SLLPYQWLFRSIAAAPRCTAVRMAEYVPQRHKCGDGPLMNASVICCTLGDALLSSSSVALIIIPFWQKPHIGTCSSIQACWTGCNVCCACSGVSFRWVAQRAGRPQSVVTCLPATAVAGHMHDRSSLPSTSTEQAPHWASPHPNCGPRNSRLFLRTYKRGTS